MSGRAFYVLVGVVVVICLAVGLLIDPAIATGLFAGGGKAEAGFAYTVDARRTPDRLESEESPDFEDSRRKPARPCSMPRASDGDELILLGTYEGAAISTVAVNGVNAETSLAEIEIQPGDRPIYLVLSSHDPMIWRFSGATGRIRSLVLVSQAKTARSTPAVGVIGVDGAVISAAPVKGCFDYFYEPGSTKAKAAEKAVDNFAGRKPDVIAGLYELQAIQLPSGMASTPDRRRPPPAPDGFDPAVWREAAHFSPGGLAQVDPATVVGPGLAESYDILPHQMGLAQLAGSGALVPTGGGFRVIKPIAHYPAGMGGAHSTTLLLASGLPQPAGDPGHSCVMYEGGRVLTERICGARTPRR